MLVKQDYITPNFLLCEIPIKDNTFHDKRLWVYCVKQLSLIEFININNLKNFQFKGKQDYFEYKNEFYFAVYVQNNCEITNTNEDELLKKAWNFLKDYLEWKDRLS